MIALRRWPFVIAANVCAVTLVAQAPARLVAMQALTVPDGRLPAGCALKTIEPATKNPAAAPDARVTFTNFLALAPAGVTINPWIGTTRLILGRIRQRIDGEARLRWPDAPLTQTDETAITRRYADGVGEGYAATYAQPGARDFAVWAVKFTGVPERRVDLPGAAPRTGVRVELGAIWAVVYGDAGPCAKGVEAYLKSLGQ